MGLGARVRAVGTAPPDTQHGPTHGGGHPPRAPRSSPSLCCCVRAALRPQAHVVPVRPIQPRAACLPGLGCSLETSGVGEASGEACLHAFHTRGRPQSVPSPSPRPPRLRSPGELRAQDPSRVTGEGVPRGSQTSSHTVRELPFVENGVHVTEQTAVPPGRGGRALTGSMWCHTSTSRTLSVQEQALALHRARVVLP